MTKKDQPALKIKNTPIKKPTPDCKNRENSQIKSGEKASLENHYDNSSFAHAASNRGK